VADGQSGFRPTLDYPTTLELKLFVIDSVFRSASTQKWEHAAAYYVDSHAAVDSFVKNSGLGFAIPYLHDEQMHDYIPDFIIRLKTEPLVHLILETKGYDPLEEVKKAAAERWVDAVNADGTYGLWRYIMVKKTTDVANAVNSVEQEFRAGTQPS
jgi:type III restriction enzyme